MNKRSFLLMICLIQLSLVSGSKAQNSPEEAEYQRVPPVFYQTLLKIVNTTKERFMAGVEREFLAYSKGADYIDRKSMSEEEKNALVRSANEHRARLLKYDNNLDMQVGLDEFFSEESELQRQREQLQKLIETSTKSGYEGYQENLKKTKIAIEEKYKKFFSRYDSIIKYEFTETDKPSPDVDELTLELQEMQYLFGILNSGARRYLQFAKLDKNHDRNLSNQEMALPDPGGFEILSYSRVKPAIEEYIAADPNNDGKIEKKEFLTLATMSFDILDLDKDNNLTIQEVRQFKGFINKSELMREKDNRPNSYFGHTQEDKDQGKTSERIPEKQAKSPEVYRTVPESMRYYLKKEDMTRDEFRDYGVSDLHKLTGGKDVVDQETIKFKQQEIINFLKKNRRETLLKLYDKNLDGVVMEEEVRKTIESQGTPRSFNNPSAAQLADTVMEKDVNKDGKIEGDEFLALSNEEIVSRKNIVITQLQPWFDMDANKDGSLTVEEFAKQLDKASDIIDLNDDQILSREELTQFGDALTRLKDLDQRNHGKEMQKRTNQKKKK